MKGLKMASISQGRSYEVIRSPLISEKSTFVSQFNHYVFKVSIDSKKHEIKSAIEKIFSVKVVSVNTLIHKGKKKRFKGKIGKRIDIKKAYIKLEKDNTIDISVGIK